MKIRDKLILSFIVIALISGVPLYFTLKAYDDINARFNHAMGNPVETIKELESLKFAGIRIVSSVSEYGFIRNESAKSGNSEMIEEEKEFISDGYKKFDESFEKYNNLIKGDDSDDVAFAGPIRKAGEKLKQSSNELIRMKEKGAGGDKVLEKKEAFEADEKAYLKAVDAALAHEYYELENEQGAVRQTINAATGKSLTVSGLIFLLALLMGGLASRNIAGRIVKLKQASEKIGAGDLDAKVEIDSTDELGALAKAFARMTGNLKTSRDEIVSARNFVDNILESMADALFVVTTDLKISRVNSAALALTGYSEEELLAVPFHKLGGKDALLSMKQLGELIERGSLQGIEGTCLSKDGKTIPISTSASVISSFPGEAHGYVLLVQDITNRKRLEGELIHQALHDPLTGLANRTLFRDRLEHALKLAGRRKDPLTVLFLDLDNFKTVNDSLGHSTGDRLLVLAAERICKCLRDSDTAARLGGDEFGILIERPTSQYNGRLIAERLVKAFNEPFMIDGREVFVGVSIGITVPESKKETPEELLRNSDVAMYLAKSQRKGSYVFFEPRMHTEIIRRMEIENDLRSAITNKEFFLNYHPIIDIGTGSIRGMETLVRWQHPARGTVPPLEFIPVAESTGLIVNLGRWILNEACRQGRVWYDKYYQGQQFSIMVNLSAREFQQPDLPKMVAAALAESGLPPHCLVLEITESMMMTNTEAMIEKLHDLKYLGVRLAIDDFGTGYSSLAYLERFPLDILKIDKSFVDKVSGDTDGAALARAIISMSETLKLETVAEGIEKPEQLDALRKLGCELGQGFHFTKPLNADGMDDFLRRGFEKDSVIDISDVLLQPSPETLLS